VNGDVNWWVPVLVGVIGVAGALLGQLVAARRENNRWRQEKEWERIKWARADAHRFGDERRGVYAEFLSLMPQWDDWSKSIADEELPDRKTFDASMHQAKTAIAHMQLLGRGGVANAAKHAQMAWGYACILRMSPWPPEPEQLQEVRTIAERGRHTCLLAMRHDLGIEPIPGAASRQVDHGNEGNKPADRAGPVPPFRPAAEDGPPASGSGESAYRTP
jgi:hypothetical protein